MLLRKRDDSIHMSGWLFADLLLALAVLFLVTNTATIQPKPIIPPQLIVRPSSLSPGTGCSDSITAPTCQVTVTEPSASTGQITWSVNSDISNSINYSTASGKLLPGRSVTVNITSLPCQNGSFTFSAQRISDKISASPVIVPWHCTPPSPQQERLNFNYQTFNLNVDPTSLLNNDSQQIDNVKQQIMSQSILQERSVGLAIVYGGAPDDGSIPQAQQVASKIYDLLKNVGQEGFAFTRSSYYVPLYTLGQPTNTVKVDVYFFCRATC